MAAVLYVSSACWKTFENYCLSIACQFVPSVLIAALTCQRVECDHAGCDPALPDSMIAVSDGLLGLDGEQKRRHKALEPHEAVLVPPADK